MKYSELLKLGREMSETEIRDSIASLAQDPRFAAVAGLIDRLQRDCLTHGSNESLAQNHGRLAHNGGAAAALLRIEDQLRQYAEPAPKRRQTPEPEMG